MKKTIIETPNFIVYSKNSELIGEEIQGQYNLKCKMQNAKHRTQSAEHRAQKNMKYELGSMKCEISKANQPSAFSLQPSAFSNNHQLTTINYLLNSKLKTQNKTREVFIQQITNGDVESAVKCGIERLEIYNILSSKDRVAIKINLGGGIDGVPSSYTDPLIVSGLIDKIKETGAEPFVCEADMRVHTMDSSMLKRRGYWELLKNKNIEFVNLSRGRKVKFYFNNLGMPVLLPLVLLETDVKIISAAPLKHHWECGVTSAQKNMYGAIAERRKSLFHRNTAILDKVIAGAARIMQPIMCVIGGKQVGAGLGPHFCVPINLNAIIFSNDMLAADAVGAEILGFPIQKVKHYMINSGGEVVKFRFLEGSWTVDNTIKEKIKKHYLSPDFVEKFRIAYLPSYFIPHSWQYKYLYKLEPLATIVNKLFYEPRGEKVDSAMKSPYCNDNK